MGTSRAERTSRLRQSMRELQDKTSRVLDIFMRHEPLMRGSIYELKRKCGKASCHCANDQTLHSSIAISWNGDDGRKHLRHLSPKEQMEFAHLTDNYRKYRRARIQLMELQKEMLELVNKLEKLRRREP